MDVPLVYSDWVMSTLATQPVAAAWRTLQLRLTAFPTSGMPASLARDWWVAITQTSPSEINEQPRKGVMQIKGLINGTSLLMTADSTRLDIRQVFEGPSQMESSLLPVYTDMLPKFTHLAIRWLGLETCPQLQRLAFGSIMAKPSSSLDECRETLASYLPMMDLSEAEMRDFLYQVNPRRVSEVIDALTVNRLMKWSVGVKETVIVNTDNRSVVVGPDREFRSQLEVDITHLAKSNCR